MGKAAQSKEGEGGSFLAWRKWRDGLVSPAGSVSSRQSATGARSPLGTRFWSGCWNSPQGAVKDRCCPVSPTRFQKSGAGLVLRETTRKKNMHKRRNYVNFLSYSSAAISTTKQEPALCTSAPVTGVSSSNRERTIATKLMHIDRVMLNLMVFTVALDSRFR